MRRAKSIRNGKTCAKCIEALAGKTAPRSAVALFKHTTRHPPGQGQIGSPLKLSAVRHTAWICITVFSFLFFILIFTFAIPTHILQPFPALGKPILYGVVKTYDSTFHKSTDWTI